MDAEGEIALKRSFRVFEVSKEGKLREPVSASGYRLLGAFDSKGEALESLMSLEWDGDYVILKVWTIPPRKRENDD
jgi:hypothetical protein